ncbi:MAG: diacylglycerol/lipid kinase family protein, partial [Gemmatimonadales bacterium]
DVTMRTTLVYNPSAGDEQHAGKQLVERLDAAGYDARLVSDRKKLERRLEDPGELVVVAGGDGSVRAVALALAGRDVPMAILPMGTANNIGKSLGIMGSVPVELGRPAAPRRTGQSQCARRAPATVRARLPRRAYQSEAGLAPAS